jgi:hypothetical protein
VILRRAFRGFSRLGFSCKNPCLVFLFDLLLFARFYNKWYQSLRLPDRFAAPGDFRCAPGAAPRFFWINICSFASFAKVSHSCVSRDPIYQIDMVLATATHAFPFAICFRTIAVQLSC